MGLDPRSNIFGLKNIFDSNESFNKPLKKEVLSQ